METERRVSHYCEKCELDFSEYEPQEGFIEVDGQKIQLDSEGKVKPIKIGGYEFYLGQKQGVLTKIYRFSGGKFYHTASLQLDTQGNLKKVELWGNVAYLAEPVGDLVHVMWPSCGGILEYPEEKKLYKIRNGKAIRPWPTFSQIIKAILAR